MPMNVASAFVTGARLIRRPPDVQLRASVGCFWALPCTAETRIRSLPDGCATLSIELSQSQAPQSFLTGPRIVPGELVPARDLTLVGVRLRPGVLFAMTGVPAWQLTGRREPLARWRAADAGDLERGLAVVSSHDERFDVLEAFVRARLAHAAVDTRVLLAVEFLRQSEGRMRIVELANRCGMSVRHLNRLLRGWVGLSPKTFARIMRFQASLGRLNPSSPPDLAGMANGLGYFDQAHLSNEFVQLAGSSPRRIAPGRVADFSKTKCE
jgi:AraC-like DNA-binding protein